MEIAKGVKKKLIRRSAATRTLLRYNAGSKLFFHFRTRNVDSFDKYLDDSRTWPKPMELIIGKEFKLPVWEVCLHSMAVGEIAEFECDKYLVEPYPSVAKQLRDIMLKGKTQTSHSCCGMTASESSGYTDLDELRIGITSLCFEFELLNVYLDGEFEKDIWAMSENEKFERMSSNHQKGNELYKLKSYKPASDKYAEAIGIIDDLIYKERPGDDEHIRLGNIRNQILSNYCQCLIFLEDFYPVIEHTSTILEKQPHNIKALYRRAIAHKSVWNFREAREDLKKLLDLDPSMKSAADKQINDIQRLEKNHFEQDRSKFKNMFS